METPQIDDENELAHEFELEREYIRATCGNLDSWKTLLNLAFSDPLAAAIVAICYADEEITCIDSDRKSAETYGKSAINAMEMVTSSRSALKPFLLAEFHRLNICLDTDHSMSYESYCIAAERGVSSGILMKGLCQIDGYGTAKEFQRDATI